MSTYDGGEINLGVVQFKLAESDLYPNGLERAKVGDAGIDLRCREHAVKLEPGQVLPIRTGVMLNMQNPNIFALTLPRSGLGSKGLIFGNTAGVIDSGYQGEIIVFAWNRNINGNSIYLKRGDRFAQMLFLPVLTPFLEQVEEFSETTERGEGGYGSTGSV